MNGDSQLYTGITSKSFRPEPQKIVEEKKQEKREDRAKLLPGAELVLRDIDLERKRVDHIDTFDEGITDPQKHLIDTLARKQYHTYLKTLEMKMKNILRESPK